ncbi:MAG: hypothetical protein AAGF83_23050 [Cyanobacteria bacterium P01_G01_bin.67]
MKIKWQQLWLKIIFWLGTEILLTAIGLDDLADYDEFLSQQKQIASMGTTYPTLTIGETPPCLHHQKHHFICINYSNSSLILRRC